MRPSSSVTTTSNPITTGSAPSGPRPHWKRAWLWWASTSPTGEKTKPGNCSWTAAMVAITASRPVASAIGST